MRTVFLTDDWSVPDGLGGKMVEGEDGQTQTWTVIMIVMVRRDIQTLNLAVMKYFPHIPGDSVWLLIY